ncbi:Phosducin-like protein 2 [Rhizoclosmatium sp. JEL0117]|nr:Phosducin-like protein 2 [Rhizoclosmatium sp. JEL0117]
MATLNMDDERIIQMLQNGGLNGDNDDLRYGSDADSDAGSCCEESHEADEHCQTQQPQSVGNSKVDRIMSDQNVRQTLGMGGKAMTGVKGVINDAKFHEEQEKNRSLIQQRAQLEKFQKNALQSGWLERQLEAEKNWNMKDEGDEDIDDLIRDLEDEEDAFVKEYKAKRLMEMAVVASLPKYGTLKEIEVDEYVSCVENVDRNVVVLVHLYQPQVEACRLVNRFLEVLAAQYPLVKMVKIISTKADASFDNIALPALLIYKGGELQKTLLRITDEIQGWARTGRCDLDDFEEYLIRNNVVSRE